MHWYEVTFRHTFDRQKDYTDCYKAKDLKDAVRKCRRAYGDINVHGVQQLVPAVDAAGAMLLAQADTRKPLRGALKQIVIEAYAGLVVLNYPSLGALQDIKSIASGALVRDALATPDAPAPDTSDEGPDNTWSIGDLTREANRILSMKHKLPCGHNTYVKPLREPVVCVQRAPGLLVVVVTGCCVTCNKRVAVEEVL